MRSDARIGGSQFSGIAPSAQTPNVFVYSDPSAGSEFGYDYDGWDTDQRFYSYTGDGQEGDQQLTTPGNAAILHHKRDGKALRLFEAAGTKPNSGEVIQRYVGRFELDDAEPYAMHPAPDRTGKQRDVIVFRLRELKEGDPDGGTSSGASWSDELINADSALAELHTIRVYTHSDGQRAPYQYVVLLWAISRVRAGQREPVPFQDVRVELPVYLMTSQ